MTPTQIKRRTRRPLATTVAGAALAAGGLLGAALPADAAPTAKGSGNPTLSAAPGTGLSPTAKTTVQVKGIDYLMPESAGPVTGGVYVFFGWVDTSKAKWGPSGRNINNTDGNFGTTYLYPGEGGSGETREDQAGMAMVSFTESGESGTATEHHMDDSGNWSVPITVPGAVFTTQLPGGGSKTTDCTRVTCGIFTIGAHGKASATNEKFTPIKFAGSGSTAAPTTSATPKPSSTSTARPTSSATSTVRATTNATNTVAPTGLPKTGADDAPVTAENTQLDDGTVLVGVRDLDDGGNGGGLAMFGVAALATLVAALVASLYLRFRRT